MTAVVIVLESQSPLSTSVIGQAQESVFHETINIAGY
jgi:hypothetical protein